MRGVGADRRDLLGQVLMWRVPCRRPSEGEAKNGLVDIMYIIGAPENGGNGTARGGSCA